MVNIQAHRHAVKKTDRWRDTEDHPIYTQTEFLMEEQMDRKTDTQTVRFKGIKAYRQMDTQKDMIQSNRMMDRQT